MADVEKMLAHGIRSTEDIGVSTVFQPQSLLQLLGANREIACGDVGASDACKSP